MALVRPLIRACLIISLIGAASPALASRCGPYLSLKTHLAAQFQERHAYGGQTRNPDWRAEVWLSKGGKTWTIIAVNNKTNLACLVMAGKNWKKPGQGI